MLRYLIKKTHIPAGTNTPDWVNYAGKRGIIIDPTTKELAIEFGYPGEKSALRGMRSWEATVEHMASQGEKLILEVVPVEL